MTCHVILWGVCTVQCEVCEGAPKAAECPGEGLCTSVEGSKA